MIKELSQDFFLIFSGQFPGLVGGSHHRQLCQHTGQPGRAAGAPETSSACPSHSISALCSEFQWSQWDLLQDQGPSPHEQKLLGEDGCSVNEFVAAHITETTIIISSLAECLNKNYWAWHGEILVPLKSMAKLSLTSKEPRFHTETLAQVLSCPQQESLQHHSLGNGM